MYIRVQRAKVRLHHASDERMTHPIFTCWTVWVLHTSSWALLYAEPCLCDNGWKTQVVWCMSDIIVRSEMDYKRIELGIVLSYHEWCCFRPLPYPSHHKNSSKYICSWATGLHSTLSCTWVMFWPCSNSAFICWVHMLSVNTCHSVNKMERVVNDIVTRYFPKPLHTSVCSLVIRIYYWTWSSVCLDYWKQCGCITAWY